MSGLHILNRMSVPWSGKTRHAPRTDQATQVAVANYHFYFNVCRARCLHLHLGSPKTERIESDPDKHVHAFLYAIIQTLKLIEPVIC